jgi:hypothetical protein
MRSPSDWANRVASDGIPPCSRRLVHTKSRKVQSLSDRTGLAHRRPSATQQKTHQAALGDQGNVCFLSPGFFDAWPVGLQSCGDHLRVALTRDKLRRLQGEPPVAQTRAEIPRIEADGELLVDQLANPGGGPQNRSRTPAFSGSRPTIAGMIFSWVRVNLGGRPGTGRASKLGPSLSRYAAIQRRINSEKHDTLVGRVAIKGLTGRPSDDAHVPRATSCLTCLTSDITGTSQGLRSIGCAKKRAVLRHSPGRMVVEQP